jgi:phage gp37-like protein
LSELLQLRDAIVAALAASLGDGWDVKGHLGRFDANSLSAFLTAAPAVRVAILGLANAKAADESSIDYLVRVGIYVVAKDQGELRLSREVIAMGAVERIAKLAFNNRWGMGFCFPAEPAGAQNMDSAETLKRGVALWAIDLGQPARLTTSAAEDALDPLGELWVGFAPRIGAAHREDYFGPFPPFHGELPDV